MEWGSFDLNSQVVIVPRGYKFTGDSGQEARCDMGREVRVRRSGRPGLRGLPRRDEREGARRGRVLSSRLRRVSRVRPGEGERVHGPRRCHLVSPFDLRDRRRGQGRDREGPRHGGGREGDRHGTALHYLVTEPSGKAVVIEYLNGDLKLFDAPLGVITNSPTYDWHEINLRNYLNLSAVALPSRKIEEMNFAPLGGGSGMIGLPGDFTPPSRFVRAVAFSKSARSTPTGEETVYELFRILDNFNVPLGAAEGEGEDKTKGMRSSTLWTSVWDTKNLVMYYHTQNNRRVRQVDLKKLDFTVKDRIRFPLDKEKNKTSRMSRRSTK